MLRSLYLIALLCLCAPLRSQSSEQQAKAVPAFEVSVVRPESTEREMGFQITADGMNAQGVTLDTLLRVAYNLDEGQIAGEPKWAASTKFSVQGKVAADDVAAWQSLTPDQARIAIQKMIATSFQLKTHWESKTSTVLDLVVSDGGTERLDKHRSDVLKPERSPMEAYPGHIEFGHASLDALCTVLSSQMERKVINKTSVAGDFEFDLKFSPVEQASKEAGTSDSSLPSLYEELKQTLGLRLVPRKESVPMLVLDDAKLPQV